MSIEPTLAATWMHLTNIAEKRDLLTQRLYESIDQLCEMARRTPMDPMDAWAMYQDIRSFGLPAASKAFAEATGFGVARMAEITRYGGPLDLAPGTKLASDDDPPRKPRPGCPVVYVLIDHDVLVYVGVTSHLSARIAAHRGSGKVFDRWVCTVHATRSDANEHEAQLIRTYRPKLNVAGVWS